MLLTEILYWKCIVEKKKKKRGWDDLNERLVLNVDNGLIRKRKSMI